jgi:hypothetical protein
MGMRIAGAASVGKLARDSSTQVPEMTYKPAENPTREQPQLESFSSLKLQDKWDLE